MVTVCSTISYFRGGGEWIDMPALHACKDKNHTKFDSVFEYHVSCSNIGGCLSWDLLLERDIFQLYCSASCVRDSEFLISVVVPKSIPCTTFVSFFV
jgi:hypothetical protein